MQDKAVTMKATPTTQRKNVGTLVIGSLLMVFVLSFVLGQSIEVAILGGLVAISAFLVVWNIYELNVGIFAKSKAVPDEEKKEESGILSVLIPYARTGGLLIQKMYLALGVDVRSYDARDLVETPSDLVRRVLGTVHTKLDMMLLHAGYPWNLNSFDVMGMMIVGGVVGTLLGLMDSFVIDSPLFIGGMGVVGMLVPPIWLYDVMSERKKEMQKILPFSLDLISLSVEAGLDITQAVGWVVRKQRGNPFARELDLMLHEIRMGKTRKKAFHDLGFRTDLDEFQPVVTSIIQADEMGSDLGPIMRVQSKEIRVRRFQRIEKKINQAPVKMLIPLIFFMFPTLIVIFGPVILKFLG